MVKKDEYKKMSPGALPIDKGTGMPACPPPREVLAVRLERIYNECKQTTVDEIPITITTPIEANKVKCASVKIENVSCESLENDQVVVTYDMEIVFKLFQGKNLVQIVTEKIFGGTKTVGLPGAGQCGFKCEVDIYPECLICFVSGNGEEGLVNEVTCCVGKLYVFRLVAPVQVLIPSFGFCPEPPECGIVAGLCPDYRPKWPPYPACPSMPVPCLREEE